MADQIVAKERITAERLRELLDYDPATGVFTWKVWGGKAKPGKIAGGYGRGGYLYVTIDRRQTSAASLAFLHFHGRWPVDLADHRNNVVDDNRIDNLREATDLQNSRNRKPAKKNKSGFKGVFWWKKGRGWWRAVIMVSRKQKLLGQFATKEEAARAYDRAAKELFGEFAYFNFPQEQA